MGNFCIKKRNEIFYMIKIHSSDMQKKMDTNINIYYFIQQIFL